MSYGEVKHVSGSPFNFTYAKGMTIGRTRHTIYRDWNKKVQMEYHGNNVSYWADNCKTEFKTEQELINWYNSNNSQALNFDNDPPII